MADQAMNAAFQQAAAGAAASTGEWAGLKAAAGEGRLWIEPGAAQKCAAGVRRRNWEVARRTACTRYTPIASSVSATGVPVRISHEHSATEGQRGRGNSAFSTSFSRI